MWTSKRNGYSIQWQVIITFYFFILSVFSSSQYNVIQSMNSVIRTTHVTGTFTDIGIILGRRFKGNSVDMWKLKILIPLAIGKL